MFMKTLYTPGLAHLSYIFGDGDQASVIDPRRDVNEYLEIAHRRGAKITHIFETHRNEDYVIGSLELARRTGAEIYHGSQLDFQYGNPVNEGDEFQLGNVNLWILQDLAIRWRSIRSSIATWRSAMTRWGIHRRRPVHR